MTKLTSHKYVICSIGLTANGKTTLMKQIASHCNIPIISEGAIKRGMVHGTYTVINSVDEALRSNGYKEAIKQAFDVLKYTDAVIIDASFHQLFRRLWIYDEIDSRKIDADKITVIWVYCICEDETEISNRIRDRFYDPIKTADNQANTYDVYLYTKSTFDPVNISDFINCPKSYIFTYDSLNSKIVDIKVNISTTPSIGDIKLDGWRELWVNYM